MTHIIVQENTEAVDFLYNTYYRTGETLRQEIFFITHIIVQENTEAGRFSIRTGKH